MHQLPVFAVRCSFSLSKDFGWAAKMFLSPVAVPAVKVIPALGGGEVSLSMRVTSMPEDVNARRAGKSRTQQDKPSSPCLVTAQVLVPCMAVQTSLCNRDRCSQELEPMRRNSRSTFSKIHILPFWKKCPHVLIQDSPLPHGTVASGGSSLLLLSCFSSLWLQILLPS